MFVQRGWDGQQKQCNQSINQRETVRAKVATMWGAAVKINHSSEMLRTINTTYTGRFLRFHYVFKI